MWFDAKIDCDYWEDMENVLRQSDSAFKQYGYCKSTFPSMPMCVYCPSSILDKILGYATFTSLRHVLQTYLKTNHHILLE